MVMDSQGMESFLLEGGDAFRIAISRFNPTLTLLLQTLTQ